MKNYYTLACLLLLSLTSLAQGYEFGIVHLTGANFKIVAIPDFDSSGNTDISDIGFALVLPACSNDIVNEVGLLGGRTWGLNQIPADFLTGLELGDGTKDVFVLNLPGGQTILSHTNGQQIDLVSFEVSDSPVTGEMYFLLNSDPIASGSGGALNSFYNSNIDNTSTQNYFSGLAAGMESFSFLLLGVDDASFINQAIEIYPNPSSNFVNINSTLELSKIEIYSLLGSMVLETKNTDQIDVSALHTGMYLLKLYTEKGTGVKKIIIE